MTFVTAGLALAGLIGIAIPILIHLLWRQRRKPVMWGAMRFLIEAYRKHRRRLRIEQLLLLAVRCLVIGVLGLALARPILDAAGVIDLGGARHVYLVLDDGLASGIEFPDGTTAFERQVDMAVSVIDDLDPGDFVGLITAAAPARTTVVPPSSDHRGVVELLRSMKPSEAPTDLAGALTALSGVLGDEVDDGNATLVYLFSEFRAGSAPLSEPLAATLEELPRTVALLAAAPASESVANTQIVAIEPLRSVVLPGAIDGSGQVTVRLRREGGQLGADVSRVRIFGDDLSSVEPRVVQWKPGDAEIEVEFMLDIATQGQREIEITASIDDDPLGPDNRRYAVLQARDRIRVLLIDRRSFGLESSVARLGPGQWIRRALEPTPDGPLEAIEVEPAAMDDTDLRGTDVAILPRPDLLSETGWSALRRFVDAGGLLIVTPPGEIGVHQWTERLADDLALPWRVALEVREHPDGLGMSEQTSSGRLLRMISGELRELARPVITRKVLPVLEEETQGERALRFADESTMLLVGSPQVIAPDGDALAATSPGLVAYLATAPDLEWTNLPSKPLMVPLLHELIRQGLSVIRASRRTMVGAVAGLGLPPAARSLRDEDGSEIVLDDAGRPQMPISTSGLWTAIDGAGQPLGPLAVNVDPRAGHTQPQSDAAVATWLADSGPWSFVAGDELAGSLGEAEAGSPVSWILLLVLLGLVVLETILARLFSHAGTGGRAAKSALEEKAQPMLGGLR